MIENVKAIYILISSPKDVQKERVIAEKILYEWNSIFTEEKQIVLLPLKWESDVYSDMSGPPQIVINEQIVEKCDMVIGIFWNRIGTKTENYVSGSVEEIEMAIKRKKDVMIYFSNSKEYKNECIDMDQRKEVDNYKFSLQNRGLYFEYCSHNEFEKILKKQFEKRFSKEDYRNKQNGNERDIERVPKINKSIIKEFYKVLYNIMEYNSRNKTPNMADIISSTGVNKLLVAEIINTLRVYRMIDVKYTTGIDPYYQIKESGRSFLSRFQ